MNKKSVVLALSASLLAGSAFAGTMGTVVEPDWAWVGSLSLGPVWESAGRTQTFFLAPEIERSYVANKSSSGLIDGEIFFGAQRGLSDIFSGQLGLALAATGNAKLDGVIWDDADPTFNNYTYNYKVQHSHVAVKGKLLADAGYWVMPWISASLGVGFNRAHDYSSTPVIFEALPTPNFTSHTQTAFTYTLGVGLQRAIDSHWGVGAGYEFASWGKSNLGRAAGQVYNSGLSLNHLYTNGLMFNLTYVA